MSTVVLGGLVGLAAALIWWRHGPHGVVEGFGQTGRMLRSIGPMMLIGLIIAGMAQVALPGDVISRWLGDESGFTGIMIAIAVGAAVPGGPYVVIPLLGSLMTSGAGVGPIAAFMTAWSVIPISRTLVYELPFLGAGFALSRYLVVLPFPIAAGVLAPPVFRLFT